MTVPWPVQQGVYTAFCGIGALVAYFPLYWNLEAWNSASVLWIFWAGTSCLIHFINAIIWHDNAENIAPVWCDISSRWIHVESIGIITAGALLNHRLYKLLKFSRACNLEINRKAMVIFDVCVGLGLPLIFVALYWFIQGHRFNIFEGIGCFPAAILIPSHVVTYGMWPTLICLISACYGALTLKQFIRHRRNIRTLIDQSSLQSTPLTDRRYLRLMLFASIDACLMAPFNIFALVYTCADKNNWYPYSGLSDLHYDFSRVGEYSQLIWRSNAWSSFQAFVVPGTAIGSSFIFFIFFGLSPDARTNYGQTWAVVRGWVRRHIIHVWPLSLRRTFRPRSRNSARSDSETELVPRLSRKTSVLHGVEFDRTSIIFAHTISTETEGETADVEQNGLASNTRTLQPSNYSNLGLRGATARVIGDKTV